MDLEELVVGVRKANLDELKELKVKLPVRLLVNLHYVKLTQSRAISEVVKEALSRYFAAMVPPAPPNGASMGPGSSTGTNWLEHHMQSTQELAAFQDQ